MGVVTKKKVAGGGEDRRISGPGAAKKMRFAPPTGFEPMRAEPRRFLVYRLNHSATVANAWRNDKNCGILINRY